ncbi:hypothetical protein GQX73_g5788 [Xylaria multiplex]|uniref:Peptidase metallopeptidase domain-containing protein n=1 Tax=Xylaria multiplex TaxID=323545 RepID=A0A7C8IMV7_9PEZI|nr:hypothetical protein GQX73_g5788 [Xylaria multiplex]
MATHMYTHDLSPDITDDESGGDIPAHPRCEDSSRTSVQPMPYDRHDQCDTNYDAEFIEGSGASTIPTHRSETETVFSQDDESVLTGPTDFVSPSSSGRSHKGQETITLSSVVDETIFPNQLGGLSSQNSDRVEITPFIGPEESSATAADPISGPPIEDIDFEDDSTGSTSMLPNHDVIKPLVTPRMNYMNWEDTSRCAPASTNEFIDHFDAKFNHADISSTSNSGVGDDLVPARTIPVSGSAAARDRGPLNYTTIHKKVNKRLPSPDQLENFLSPEKLREACNLYESFADYSARVINFLKSNTLFQPPQDNTCVPPEDIVNRILQIITLGLDGSAAGIRCGICKPRLGAADIAALRFGLDGMITLHHLENNEPITFVCCDESFPFPEWAEEAVNAFRKGAKPWAQAGLTFTQVSRNEVAHFRIAFSLFPSDLDCSVLAQAFFPGTEQPEQRTLWVYLLAFHPYYSPYLAGYMAHEAGHIGGARHGFDEHLLPDGSEITELKPVLMGIDDPRSVMNYHDNPSDYAIQPSDIRDIRNMYNHPGDEYQNYKIIKVRPEVEAYSGMMPFGWVANYLHHDA